VAAKYGCLLLPRLAGPGQRVLPAAPPRPPLAWCPNGVAGCVMSADRTTMLLVGLMLLTRTAAAAAAAHRPVSIGDSDADGPFGAETDCAVRGLLLEHAQHIQPQLSSANLQHVFDSLELAGRCNTSRPLPPATPPPPPATPVGAALFVDFATGDDSAAGAVGSPFKTIAKALAVAGASKTVDAIVLRAGVHFLESTLQLTPAHSDLLITAFCSGSAPCEEVWLSGGIPLPAAAWTPHNVSNGANIWQRDVPAAAAAAGAVPASALHWLEDLEGATALTRARWPNRRPQDGTIDKPSLLDITASSAVWLQPPTVRPALHKAVVTPAIPLTVTGEFNQWMVVRKRFFCASLNLKNPTIVKTGSGQTYRKI
jgi:hypothetical protein